MNTNPYESPQSEDSPRPSAIDQRVRARRDARVALLILLVPAFYNFVCFNFSFDASRIGFSVRNVYQLANGVGFIAGAVAIWILALPVLEFLTGGFHAVFGRNSKLDDWKTALYRILRRAPIFAVGGAILWAIWVGAFYQLGIGFYTVSVPIGVAAHVLAAGLYLPLFYRWYELERAAAR